MQSGALLIEGAPLSSTTTSNRGRTAHSAAGTQNNSFSSDFWGGLLREGDTRGLVPRDAALSGDPWGAGGGGGNGDDDSDDDSGGGFGGGYGGFGGGDEDDDGGVEESKGGETEPVRGNWPSNLVLRFFSSDWCRLLLVGAIRSRNSTRRIRPYDLGQTRNLPSPGLLGR